MPIYIAGIVRDERLYNLGKIFSVYGYEPVPIEKQHLTILFIGDVDSYHRYLLLKRLSSKVFNHNRILELDGIELLPQHKATNIVLRVVPSEWLFSLRHQLKELIGDVVALNDRYSFYPHITIARRPRVPDEDTIEAIKNEINRIVKKRIVPRTTIVKGIAVIESFRGLQNILLWLSEPIST